MSNNVQKDFENLIKNLTTEITKEVLIEDLRNIHGLYEDTYLEYEGTHKNYVEEFKDMKNEITNFSNYTADAIKHSEVLKNLNDTSRTTLKKLDEVTRAMEESKQAVLKKMLSDNEELFKKYKEQVAQLNQKEEERFIRSIKKQLDESERRLSLLNNDIKSLIVETDYNREYVLKDMLNTNAKFAESYQNIIKEFNSAETAKFFKHLEAFVNKQNNEMIAGIDRTVGAFKEELEASIRRLQLGYSENTRLFTMLRNEQAEFLDRSSLQMEKLLTNQIEHDRKLNEKVDMMIDELNKEIQNNIIENKADRMIIAKSVKDNREAIVRRLDGIAVIGFMFMVIILIILFG